MRSLGAQVLCLFLMMGTAAVAASSNSPWSPLPYRSADGWHWDPRQGMWRNPTPRFDKDSKSWVHDTRYPSSTGCCDKTGLSYPPEAVNSFDEPEPPKKRTSQPQDTQKDATKQRRNALEDQIRKIRGMNLDPEVEERAIEALRDGRQARSRPSLRALLAQAMREQEARQAEADAPRAGVRYGYVEGEEPVGRRDRASVDARPIEPSYAQPRPTAYASEEGEPVGSARSGFGSFLSDAADVAGALVPVAGAAAGLAASNRGSAAPSIQPVRRSQTQYPQGPRYGASDISGLK